MREYQTSERKQNLSCKAACRSCDSILVEGHTLTHQAQEQSPLKRSAVFATFVRVTHHLFMLAIGLLFLRWIYSKVGSVYGHWIR